MRRKHTAPAIPPEIPPPSDIKVEISTINPPFLNEH
jgi:hypothetical protein